MIDVPIGKIRTAGHGETLVASGIGSCLIITLFSARLKIGAMAHAMLPNRPPAQGQPNDGQHDTRYVDAAIEEMLKELEARGAHRSHLEAKLIGGANMFSSVEYSIGNDNISIAREKLKKEGIKPAGESVGGCQGRSVEFSIDSGIVTVKVKL
jgi:chemotaxis protein CheD